MKASEYFPIIEKAITIFQENPNLFELGNLIHKVGISEKEFELAIQNWAKVSSIEFFTSISPQQIKALITDVQPSLFDDLNSTIFEHNAQKFVFKSKIIPFSNEEKSDNYSSLTINYSFEDSIFGNLILASTSKGVCYAAFEEDGIVGLEKLKSRFKNAIFVLNTDKYQKGILSIFRGIWKKNLTIQLHLDGTEFQINVWKALLEIPFGRLYTYHQLAKSLQIPQSSRAVGTAIGRNPIALVIPCHRAVRSTGEVGKYHWGSCRKLAIIGWETAQLTALHN